MDPRAAEFEILFRITGVEGDVAGGDGEHVLDKRARKADTSVVAEDRAGAGHDLDPGLRRVGKADLFQRIKRRLVDAPDTRLGQWFVLAAWKPRANRPDVFRKRSRAKRHPRRPSPGSSRNRNCAFVSHYHLLMALSFLA
ncbi:hypothetical protein ABIA14_000926 [Sinorhizobium fredii]